MQVGCICVKQGVCKSGAAPIAAVCGRHVAALGVCRKVEDVAVAAGAQENRVGCIALNLAVDEVAHDYSLGVLLS